MPTLQDALRTFLNIERRPVTNDHYALVLGRMVAAIGPARDVARVTYEDLLDYQASLRSSLKPGSVAHYTNITKIFFNWCVKRGYISLSPADDLIVRFPPRDPTRQWAIPPEELARIVEYARVTSARDYALIMFMVDTGVRVGAVSTLSCANLHLEHGFAFVLEKGGRWHKARFGDETAKALRRWLELRPTPVPEDHDFVWTSVGPDYARLQAPSIRAMVKRICRHIGASREWNPHAFRHSVGEAYANAGIPVTVTQAKLGHSSPLITMQSYYPITDAQVDHVSQTFPLLALQPSQIAPKPLVKREPKRKPE